MIVLELAAFAFALGCLISAVVQLVVRYARAGVTRT